MKTSTRLLAFACMMMLCLNAYSDELGSGKSAVVKTIVIDPGHGGADYPGAIGPGGLMEKDLTLSIAIKLRQLIRNDPVFRDDGVRVVLTRQQDRAVMLEERAAIANSTNGDLFISIHANGYPSRSAKGAETYFLSLKATDFQAKFVAEIENREFASQPSEVISDQESDALKLILFDFIQKQYIAESKFLAEHIQNEFNRSLGTGTRGVRQAMFRVLKGVAMPAVLVEVDFITNPARERLLTTADYQWELARSMLKAIKEYKSKKERGYSKPEETEDNSGESSTQ